MLYDAWIVGSGAEWYSDESKDVFPKDIDIIIPPDKFNDAIKIMPRDVDLKLNHFGGFKICIENVEVDFWPMTLDNFISIVDRHGKQAAVKFNPYICAMWVK